MEVTSSVARYWNKEPRMYIVNLRQLQITLVNDVNEGRN